MKFKNLYTKKGDAGFTDLFMQDRVKKDHPKILLLGEIDYFHAALGLCQCYLKKTEIDEHLKKSLLFIQEKLTRVMGEIASDPMMVKLNKTKHNFLTDEDIQKIEFDMLNFYANVLDARDQQQKGWVLYGETGKIASAQLYFATTICRKVECQAVAVNDESYTLIIKFFNILSKVLFLMAKIKE